MVGVAIIKLLVKRKKKQPEMWFRRNRAIAKEGAAYPSPHKKTFAEFQKKSTQESVVVQVVLALNRRRSLFLQHYTVRQRRLIGRCTAAVPCCLVFSKQVASNEMMGA